MAIKPLSEESEYHVVHPNQDCRGWPVVDEGGRPVGKVQELIIDTERDRVAALRLADGAEVPVERVTLLDGSVVLDDEALAPAVARRSERWSELHVQRRKAPRSFASFEDELRRHHLMVAADSGLSFEDMLPHYRHGYELASGDRYVGRPWDAVAGEVRTEWEPVHPGSPWPRVEAAVKGAWDHYRGSL